MFNSNSTLDVVFLLTSHWMNIVTSVTQKLQVFYRSSLLFSHCFHFIIMCRNLYQMNGNHCHGNSYCYCNCSVLSKQIFSSIRRMFLIVLSNSVCVTCRKCIEKYYLLPNLSDHC